MAKKHTLIERIKQILAMKEFISKHKAKPTDFTRDRTLGFRVVFMLILRKSVKSLQLILNEIFMQGVIGSVVSSSAYVQARKKFKHTAFIELTEVITRGYYCYVSNSMIFNA